MQMECNRWQQRTNLREVSNVRYPWNFKQTGGEMRAKRVVSTLLVQVVHKTLFQIFSERLFAIELTHGIIEPCMCDSKIGLAAN